MYTWLREHCWRAIGGTRSIRVVLMPYCTASLGFGTGIFYESVVGGRSLRLMSEMCMKGREGVCVGINEWLSFPRGNGIMVAWYIILPGGFGSSDRGYLWPLSEGKIAGIPLHVGIAVLSLLFSWPRQIIACIVWQHNMGWSCLGYCCPVIWRVTDHPALMHSTAATFRYKCLFSFTLSQRIWPVIG